MSMSENKNLFVIVVHYLKDISVIDELLSAHRDFLRGYYDEGIFLLSGPQIPRKGGIILARGVSKEKLEELLKDDPFAQAGAAEYKVIEFEARMASPLLAQAFE